MTRKTYRGAVFVCPIDRPYGNFMLVTGPAGEEDWIPRDALPMPALPIEDLDPVIQRNIAWAAARTVIEGYGALPDGSDLRLDEPERLGGPDNVFWLVTFTHSYEEHSYEVP